MRDTGPFDLHGSSTPPAFILSQDQTLRKFLPLARLFLRFRLYPCGRPQVPVTLQLLRCGTLRTTRENKTDARLHVGSSADLSILTLEGTNPRASLKWSHHLCQTLYHGEHGMSSTGGGPCCGRSTVVRCHPGGLVPQPRNHYTGFVGAVKSAPLGALGSVSARCATCPLLLPRHEKQVPLAVTYSPTPSPGQYHRRWGA